MTTRPRVRVCARIRPVATDHAVTAVAEDRLRVELPYGDRMFPLDAVLGPEATQADVFEVAQPLVDGVAQGVDATLMAYGHTSAGKTHTMGLLDGCAEGLVLSSLRRLFDQVQDRGSVRLSFLQLHKDRAHDLLRPDAPTPLQVREVVTAGGPRNATIVVENLTQVPVASVEEARSVTQLAARQRVERARGGESSADSTLSSRAHLVVMAFVLGHERDPHAPLAEGTLTRLLLVDLAGSERSTTLFPPQVEVPEERLAESKAINASLSALGKVIIALSAGKSHVPYRDSTLTRVLQDGLGRGASVCLIACVHAGAAYTSESIATLQFASRCRRIDPSAAGALRNRELPWRHLGRYAGTAKLTAALRRFAEDCVATDAPDQALLQLTSVVDAASAELRASTPRGDRSFRSAFAAGACTPRGVNGSFCDRFSPPLRIQVPTSPRRGRESPSRDRSSSRSPSRCDRSGSPRRAASPQSIRLRKPGRREAESATVSTAASARSSLTPSVLSAASASRASSARRVTSPRPSVPARAPAASPWARPDRFGVPAFG